MKKGFTLIELLAVIVILAIIALIATPIVLNIINDSRESAGLRSAEMYLKGVETSVATATLNNKKVSDGTYEIVSGDICLGKVEVVSEKRTCNGETLNVEMNGEKPESGSITIASGKVTYIDFTYSNGKTIVKNDGKLVYGEKESKITYISLGNYEHYTSKGDIESHDVQDEICSKCGEKVLAPGLYKSNNTFVSWDQLLSKEYKTISYWDESNSSEQLKSAILNVDENGILSTPYDFGMFESASKELLDGILVIDESVKGIKSKAFEDCYKLKSVIIPNSVTFIGESAFEYCSILSSINIPNTITNIGMRAFQGCQALTSIYIPSNVQFISASTYYYYSPFNVCSSNLKIYTGASETEIPSGWEQYWNYYGAGTILSVTYGITRQEYESNYND